MGRHKGSKNKPKDPQDKSLDSSPEEEKDDSVTSSAKPAYKVRAALLKEINDSNKERRAAEETEEELLPEDVTAAVEVDVPRETPEASASEEPPAPAPEKRKIIIDGVTREVTDEELIALAQKAGAVDSRLAEASRILEDAKRRAATPSGAGQDVAIPQRNGQSDTQPPATSEADVGEITQALMYGSPEQVQSAVARLIGSGRQTATPSNFSPQQIHGLVNETIAFERAKALLDSPPDQGGYSDIWSDPMLRGMFERREAQLRDGDREKAIPPDTRPYHELYKAIGTELRQWRDDLVKKNMPATGLENRDQLKRATGVVRGGGGKIQVPLESKPKTHDEVLDGMRATRGLN